VVLARGSGVVPSATVKGRASFARLSSFAAAGRSSAGAAIGGIKTWAPKALDLALRYAVSAGLVIAVALVAAAVLRSWATRRSLARRVRFAVLPTDSFDPGEEEILRFAGQLSRIRVASGSPLVRPASAVRIRLDGLCDGRLLYCIEGSARAASLLRSVRYDEAELRRAEEFELASNPSDDGPEEPSLMESAYRRLESPPFAPIDEDGSDDDVADHADEDHDVEWGLGA